MDTIKYLEWRDSYQIGDPLIDAQHKRLFELANQVLLSSGATAINEAIMLLFRYTREHFSEEEVLMKSRNYSGLAVHREQHNELLTRLSSIAAASAQISPRVTDDIHSLMVNWILKHILEEDLKIPHQQVI